MEIKINLSKGSKTPVIVNSYIELYSLESRSIFPQSIERLRTGTSMLIPKGHIGLLTVSSSLAKKGLINKEGITILAANNNSEIYIVVNNVSKSIQKVNRFSPLAKLILIKNLDIKLDIYS